VLIAGKSGIGKSTLAIALTEQMVAKQFQFCVFDPEGDYDDLENAVSVGNVKVPPVADEALKLMQAGTNVVINTQSLNIGERPGFFADMLPRVSALRRKTGRPHWQIIDEAHHLLLAKRGDAGQTLGEDVTGVILITVHPESMSSEVLKTVTTIIALGSHGPPSLDLRPQWPRASTSPAPLRREPPIMPHSSLRPTVARPIARPTRVAIPSSF
jgi:Helicase HerA, central domain